MTFEYSFMRTPGASMGPHQCYEARKLHRENPHVLEGLDGLGR
jgi:hypothetical protein